MSADLIGDREFSEWPVQAKQHPADAENAQRNFLQRSGSSRSQDALEYARMSMEGVDPLASGG
jgi:hypothetical protein